MVSIPGLGFDPPTIARLTHAIAHGRVVCRTDCCSPSVSQLNMPRTNTVASAVAVDEMQRFLDIMTGKGATPDQVCFIIHKFIPARACAWSKADPNNQIVKIDSLWLVPDGLQYLSHDTFKYDVKDNAETGTRLRYKRRFIQECEDGSWRELRVRRSLARRRSLEGRDLADIAKTSHTVARMLGKPVLIMWFCAIPDGLKVGRNLPWFRIDPPEERLLAEPSLSPRFPKRRIRTLDHLAMLRADGTREILVLEPDVSLFRDNSFLQHVIVSAKQVNLPLELAGSTLSHAFCQLEKAGVPVILADEPQRSRVRHRQSFDKLVRDKVPQRIENAGERVIRARLPRSELRQALVAKLYEESQELLAARDPDDVKAEIADMLEVIRALATATGVEWDDVQRAADQKREERGGFEAGAILIETSWPSAKRLSSQNTRMLSLDQLAKIVSSETGVTVSFNAAVASREQGAQAMLGGLKVMVKMSREGIVLRNAPDEDTEASAQLDLPFDQPG